MLGASGEIVSGWGDGVETRQGGEGAMEGREMRGIEERDGVRGDENGGNYGVQHGV